MQIQGIVTSPGSNSTGTTPVAPQGKQGELLTSSLHGKWYNAAYNGRVFTASSLIAGVIIPVNTATAATWVIYNPVGSGVNVELISFDYGFPVAAVTVVGTLLASYAATVPSASSNLITPTPALLGGSGSAQAKVATTATVTAVTTHLPMLTLTTTADAANGPCHYDFDGKMLLAPGSLVHVTSTPVQTAVGLPCWFWAEWPI